ncbi:peptide ABC transporter substrate-binding protein [Aquibacillus salsiterrae]|uniref:Peptide ABC transporter substrate-binding protein n=1 Tax=Aquibacillus salsiterrae TaxID=2950439 RepID=A0A9X3WDV3_9BACI|nr:peptide ABC transporter substrate-binding protein [Aquibacillus salsiterrae]MDC3417208.1 peptide ABC transporter substrate-binding protein [Aquibacillus salsiterrae]
MRKANWLLLVLVVVLSMFLAACSGGDDTTEEDTGTDTQQGSEGDSTNEEGNDGKVLRVVSTSEIPSLDPAQATDSVSIQYTDSLYEGLYRLKTGGEIVSGIANEDETVISEDGLTYTFKLREDAKWSNGEPVTANDFVYAWRRAITPETASVYGEYLMSGAIKNATEIYAGELEPTELGVTAEDDYTLKVELVKPVPYFESFVAFPTFLPLNQAFVEEQGENFAIELDNLLFNGPFVLTEWDNAAGWKLERNDQYWDKDNVDLDGINVKVVKETGTAVSLYEKGEIDRVGLSGEFVDQKKTSPDYYSLSEATVFWLKFNQGSSTKGEYMQNENFRRAIAQGFDKEAFINIVYGNDSIPADYFVPSDFVQNPETGEDFRAKYGNIISYDLETAQSAWEKAKQELGFEEVSLVFLSGDSDVGKAITEFFKSELEKNLEGLTIELQNVPWSEQLEIMDAQEYELAFSGWGPDYKDAISFIDLWETGGANNDIGYSNDEYDALVKSVKNELALKPVERFEAMQEAEKIMLDEAGIGPVMQRKTSVLSKNYVTGMEQLNPFGPSYSYKYVGIEK